MDEKSESVTPQWRGDFRNEELNKLHAECFGNALTNHDWLRQVQEHSLGWVTARVADLLIGFVNVAWDGGAHAFLLDTAVLPIMQRQGVAKSIVASAVAETGRAGCDWLHVDFEQDLGPFYFDACGFRATAAGLIRTGART